ncbi:MAG: aminopeptidase P family protein [Treponema sp.]
MSSVTERGEMLRSKMKDMGLKAYCVPSSDPHQSEYLPENYKTRSFISGFTGSAGTVLVTDKQAILWTDGRYFLQAERQLQGSPFELYKMGEPGVPTLTEYLAKELKKGDKLGFDGKVVSLSMFEDIKAKISEGVQFVSDKDLVGEIWNDRPQPVLSKSFVLGKEYSGADAKEKIEKVRKMLNEAKCDSTVIGALEDICYLLNIRGNDVRCNPVVTAYALIDAKKAILFISEKQLTEEVRKYLASQGVEIQDYEAVFSEVEKLTGSVYLDPSRTNTYLYSKVKAKIVKGLNFTSKLKCVKNETELNNFREAMAVDGVAMLNIIKWVEENAGSGITEWDVSEKLLEFRKEGDKFVEESFETIAGYGPNGAVIHYSPSPSGSAKLEKKSFFLLDSGGHYLTGTTDITRTIPLGELTMEEKENYTAVLKGHIQLALAKFKKGTQGFALDALTRQPIWRLGKDYKHGTGHGVGYLLSVHEGPQSISNKFLDVPMELGMVTSDEPGLYIANKHGIRIESLIATVPFVENEHGIFYQFETITICPIDTRPIIKERLLQEEIDWLNEYHQKVFNILSKRIKPCMMEFLKEKTRAI